MHPNAQAGQTFSHPTAGHTPMTLNLTRKHKAYFAVLGLALIGLGIDRFVLGYGASNPAGATAELPPGSVAVDRAFAPASPASSTPPSAPSSSAAGRSAPPAPMVSVARRIEQAARTWTLPLEHADGFAPTPGWLAAVRPPQPAAGTPAPPSADLFRDQVAAMKLSAIIGSRRAPATLMAVINDRSVRLGGQVEGFTLESIEDRHAVLVRDGLRFELRLSE
jgi:hypothetical protein